jgi:hypothetical protein
MFYIGQRFGVNKKFDKEMSMKKGIFLAIVILLSVSSLANAWEFKLSDKWEYDHRTPEIKPFLGSLNVEYASRHMWHGYDLFHNNHGALNTSADIKFGSSGFGTNILWTRPITSGYEEWEWFVFEPYYEEDECWDDYWYETDYRLGWKYYYFPDGPLYHPCHPRDLDFQEFYGRFAFPKLFPYGVVPYYEAARIWPSEGGTRSDGCPYSEWRTYGGWFHTFGIYKDWEVGWDCWDDDWGPWDCDWWYGEDEGPGPFGLPKLTLRSSFELTYNDGAGPTIDSSRNKADHDWSYALFKLETYVPLKHNMGFTLGMNYQVSMDRSVNKDNELWITSGMRINF